MFGICCDRLCSALESRTHLCVSVRAFGSSETELQDVCENLSLFLCCHHRSRVQFPDVSLRYSVLLVFPSLSSHPLILRYHNGTLLDRTLFKYEEDLVLRDLKPGQAGHYHCKASSPAGSIKSTQAFLTVIGMYVCTGRKTCTRCMYKMYRIALLYFKPLSVCSLTWKIGSLFYLQDRLDGNVEQQTVKRSYNMVWKKSHTVH